jgi:hypothetical protein
MVVLFIYNSSKSAHLTHFFHKSAFYEFQCIYILFYFVTEWQNFTQKETLRGPLYG